MPSFGGVNIFGIAVSMRFAINPRADQENTFPGLNGVESLDHGQRGAITKVTGRLYGPSMFQLAAAEAMFRAFDDGFAYVLIDNFGSAWPFVKLRRFEPADRVAVDPNLGYTRPYSAEFFHLTL